MGLPTRRPSILFCVLLRRAVGKLVCEVFWIFFSFSFTYGNALEENSRWVGVQLETAVRDLNSLALMQTDTKKQIQLAGGWWEC